MALKPKKDGTYAVTSLKEAQEALERHRALESEIRQLMTKHEIHEKVADAAELKKAATEFAVSEELERIDCGEFHATVIKAPYDSRFILTSADIRGDEHREVKPLRAIIRKKFGAFSKGSQASAIWKRITRPTIDKDALDEVVAEGLLTVKEITPAFVEKQKAPYLRLFED